MKRSFLDSLRDSAERRPVDYTALRQRQKLFLAASTESGVEGLHGLARIKGKKLKNLYQSLVCPLRLKNEKAKLWRLFVLSINPSRLFPVHLLEN